MNPYEVLGVAKTSSTDEIKKAFRKKAMELHPDKNPGDKQKEDAFKQVNEAYDILSDPEKKQQYDMFGHIPGGAAPPPGPTNFDDIFSTFFGPGGGPTPFGGFHFGGGGGGPQQQRPPKRMDVISVKIPLHEIYYGATKKIEFELLDMCQKCEGTGANDPSSVIKCITCRGKGMIHQQMGPFMVAQSTCPSCQGRGEVRQGKACQNCRGDKTCYKKRAFEMKIPKGMKNRFELKMPNKGAYNAESKEYNDIMFSFHYDIPSNYQVDEGTGSVTLTQNITIDELIAGFNKKIKIYNDEYTLISHHYFNPNKPIIVPNKGLLNMDTNKQADLYIAFNINFTEGEKLVKYREVFHKIYKKNENDEPTEDPATPNVIWCTAPPAPPSPKPDSVDA